MRTQAIVLSVLVGLTGAAFTTVSTAGALVGRPRPRLSIETALVVWDPTTNVEHLFVAARFDDIDGPFAWWLPVPSSPTVVVEDDLSRTFSTLITFYQARATSWTLPTLPNGEPREALSFGGHGDVEFRVDALPSREAVKETLTRVGRSRDPALKDYLGRYGEGGYHMVELRIDPGTETWTSPWIHLRFETGQPWYPYREPAYPPNLDAEDDAARLLRVYVLAPEKVAMQHGQSRPTMAYAWLAFEPTHEELQRAIGPHLSDALALDTSRRLWLTSFEDRHVVRPGDDDLMFASAGLIPKDGEPGTIGDATKAGIAFEPLGAPTIRREDREGRRGTGIDRLVSGAKRIRGRAIYRPLQAFGWMVLLALGIAWKLARSDS
jgi:hypothetical protein